MIVLWLRNATATFSVSERVLTRQIKARLNFAILDLNLHYLARSDALCALAFEKNLAEIQFKRCVISNYSIEATKLTWTWKLGAVQY